MTVNVLRLLTLALFVQVLFMAPVVAGFLPAGQYCCGSPIGVPYSDFFSCDMNCFSSCFPCDFTYFGYDCAGYYGYQYSCSHDTDDHGKKMDLSLESDCDGNVLTVESGGDPLDEAHVSVKDVADWESVASGKTDSSGNFDFQGCGMEVYIKVTHEGGYSMATLQKDLISCEECEQPECTDNTRCPVTEKCVDEVCIPVQCGACEAVVNHGCEGLCAADETCVNNACTKKPEEGCRSNLNCKDNEYCDIKPGQNTGSCLPVPLGDCGEVKNHSFVSYEYDCGTEPGCRSCPEGSTCVNHKCVPIDLSCPSTGIVGANQTCQATEGGVPYANSDCVVTDPAGKEITCRTDENGNINVPLEMEGTYKVAILKDGQVVKIMEIRASPQAGQAGEEKKPTAPPADMAPLIGLFLLLLLIVLGIIYWRSRGKKR